ncbi:MAG: hypothetical protein LAT67_05140 [Balneolales bacterium]|nr:hypothetical protein [Balneolales bacterium]
MGIISNILDRLRKLERLVKRLRFNQGSGQSNDGNERWINTSVPPKSVGGYKDDEPATPSGGLTLSEAMNKLIFPSVPTAINSFTRSPAVFDFLDDEVSVNLAWDVAIDSSIGLASVRIEFRRNNTGNWNFLHQSLDASGSFMHENIPNQNNASIAYRLIATDGNGNTLSSNVLSSIFRVYQAPTVSFGSLAPLQREIGEINTTVAGTITRRSPTVALVSYQLQVQLNNGSWNNLGDSVSVANSESVAISEVNYQAPSTLEGNPVSSVRFGIRITDEQGQGNRLNSNIIMASRNLFHGSTLDATLPAIRDLSNSVLAPAEGTTFDMLIPAGAQVVAFAYPAFLRDVDQVLFVQVNIDVKQVFTKETVSVPDAAGENFTDYKLYSFRPLEPFQSPVTYRVTI